MYENILRNLNYRLHCTGSSGFSLSLSLSLSLYIYIYIYIWVWGAACPVAARSKARVCGLSLAGTAGSNPVGAWMCLCECCVLLGKCLCDGLITRPEESYRMRCIWVWLRNLIRGSLSPLGLSSHDNKYTDVTFVAQQNTPNYGKERMWTRGFGSADNFTNQKNVI